MVTATSDPWQALRIPLQMTVPAAGQACPATPARIVARWIGPAQGDGPVYPVGLSEPISLAGGASEDGWYRIKTNWVSDAAYKGLVLVRGAGSDRAAPVQFQFDDKVEAELRLPVDGTATTPGQDVGWRSWPSYTLVRAAGCYALQVDGEGFSREVNFEVVP